MTTRTPPTPGTDGLHFAMDLRHRHRLDACLGHTIRNREQGIRCPLTPDRLIEQAPERSRSQQSRFARRLGRRVGQLDLDLCHERASSFSEYMNSSRKSNNPMPARSLSP